MPLTPEERRAIARRAAQRVLRDIAPVLVVWDAIDRAKRAPPPAPLGRGPLEPDPEPK